MVNTQHQQTDAKAPKTKEELRDFAYQKGFNFRTVLERCIDGAKLRDPVDLFGGLWYEGELSALYADTNVGKSILATQIAEAVARLEGFKVLYIDLEMSDKGLECRSRTEDGKIFPYSENFYMLTIDYKKIIESNLVVDDNGFDVLKYIEEIGIESGSNVIIIDNITALCAGLETGETAVRLVTRLLKMRNDNSWSILFLAHTPKLDPTQPITRDSMAGSKRLISLIDSAFAIGVSRQDEKLRYIKQTKVRMAECQYHENNVLTARIERTDGLLQFVFGETARETDLLKERNERAERDKKILELYKLGYTHKKVSEEMRLKIDTVRGVYRNGVKLGLISPKRNPDIDDSDEGSLFQETA